MESIAPSLTLNLVAAGILFGIAQTGVISYLFLTHKDRKAHRYFLWFLLAILIAQIESFFNRSGFTASIPHFLNIATPFVFLFGPLLYMYVRRQLKMPVKAQKALLHFVPFIFYLAYSFFFYLQPEAYKFNAFANSFQPSLELIPVESSFSADPWNIRGIVVVELLSLHILLYAAVLLFTLRSFKKLNTNQDLSWLLFATGLLTVGGLILMLSQGGIVNGNRLFNNFLPTFSADLFPTIATYTVSVYLFKNGMPSGLRQSKYYKSNISKEIRNSQHEKIIMAMESNRLFVDPNFSLKLLANSCGLSTHHVSQVLNEEMDCTFFELTNKYRIEEAKRLLNETAEYIKMEQLAYQIGYKSKSTFFSAFKKATNLTPLKYQESKANKVFSDRVGL